MVLIAGNTVRFVCTNRSTIDAATYFGLNVSQPNPVPTPLPVLGPVAAFGFCRRLRSRCRERNRAS
jgi:hypothetical protein